MGDSQTPHDRRLDTKKACPSCGDTACAFAVVDDGDEVAALCPRGHTWNPHGDPEPAFTPRSTAATVWNVFLGVGVLFHLRLYIQGLALGELVVVGFAVFGVVVLGLLLSWPFE